jgi:hypothetical protein
MKYSVVDGCFDGLCEFFESGAQDVNPIMLGTHSVSLQVGTCILAINFV